jgi:hypothetical protein
LIFTRAYLSYGTIRHSHGVRMCDTIEEVGGPETTKVCLHAQICVLNSVLLTRVSVWGNILLPILVYYIVIFRPRYLTLILSHSHIYHVKTAAIHKRRRN